MKLFIPDPEKLPIQHPQFPWYLGSPDALVLSNDEKIIGGVDFKTTGSKNGYGKPGSDVVPDHIACQCHWYMGLTGAQWWDVATLFMGYRREFHIFHLDRNEEIISNLIAAGQEFWNLVTIQLPPELDASEASGTLLKSLYPDSKGEVLPAPESALSWRIKLNDANENLKIWEEEKKLAQHHLEALVGDADSLLWPDGWRFDWKKQKDRVSVDWLAAFNQLAAMLRAKVEVCESVMKENTTIKPGPRVPRLWPAKEKK